ncbi:protein phosphatase 1 regulatory subunit 35-like [Girardinichthys multiradiatus]|uniref:protein phosphatase 1 regulatory subunit 35-like n=1 Tax=Girardinichthys multiradiatus TaxID=208333 RepID=UPI001FADDE1D|nr:protein phosphatase 1 regulatory subunit 35-like [Girardinichthys multiradiatus]
MSFSILNSPPPSPSPIPVPLPSPSCVAHCPELDLSVTLSPASKTDRMQQNPRQPKQSQQRAQPQPRPRPRGQAGKKRKTKVHFEEPVAVTVTPEPHIVPHQQPIKGQRRSSGHHHVGRCSVDTPPAAFVQDPCCLENAELNSTLALKVELQSLQETEFNSQKALQETLQKSERTKTLINARATEVVNVSRSQHLFNSLVSVNVQEDELLSQVLQARLMLAPPPSCCYDNNTAEGPTLKFFTPPDLFRQTPIPQEEEPALCKPSPVACTAYSTFDLYRRQRCWEATP